MIADSHPFSTCFLALRLSGYISRRIFKEPCKMAVFSCKHVDTLSDLWVEWSAGFGNGIGGGKMRAVIQRVSRAAVTVDQEQIGAIGPGLVVLLGIHREDQEGDRDWLVDKIVHLRIFEDGEGKMNRSLLDTGGAMLIVSQFTLYGDCRKGRRPGYSQAARPEQAEFLYESFIRAVGKYNIQTATGRFQAAMAVELVNDGPVTMLLDSAKMF
jgi:D-aminoacyl-tRNA deacylase